MKQPGWLPLIFVFAFTTLWLDACSAPASVLPTATSFLPTATLVPPTAIAVPPTDSPTPAPVIGVDTIPRLSIFKSIGQGDFLRSLAFSPDGTVLASMATDNEDFAIRLWKVADGFALGRLEGHSANVWGLAFSPNGNILVSVSSDGTAKLWDWRAGILLKSLDFPGEVVSVAFSPDGQTLAVGGVDESQDEQQNAAVWTFSVNTGEPLLKFPELLNIPALAYSPDGSLLVGGGSSRNVQVWRADDGAPVFTLNHPHQVSSLAISPDGTTVATGTCETVEGSDCRQGSVWLWDLLTGKLIAQLTDFPDEVEKVAFSPNGSLLIAGSRGGTLHAYSTSGYLLVFETTEPGGFGAMALSTDGRMLATGGDNGEVHLWSVEQ
ncbi:MAG TPA: WD40 repeat domain-containing protein [Anaerolineales bacterium]|nr:WD40 repeat domain-containing protein [Anaerolineales bacterium]